MPLTRYQIRSEYGLADPDLYRTADKDDPEALLEGVAMAGLVGILRQLGDLAEFAAEMFHELHEEVMSTAARGHGLMVRVQQLEAEFPKIEKALLSRTDHSPFFSNTGVEWRPNVQLEQALITRGDLPRCVMSSYEECRGPPRLFLLDKFDVAGAGACLKRYSDPSFFRLETSSSEASLGEMQREKKPRKAKKKGATWRNGGKTEVAPTSHAKLHELFLEEHVQGVLADPSRLVKLKTRKLEGYSLNSKSGESYMEKFVHTCVDHKTDNERTDSDPELLTWNMDGAKDSVTDIPEINVMGVVEKSYQRIETEISPPSEQESVPKYNINGNFVEKDVETVPESIHVEAEEVASTVPEKTAVKDLGTNLNGVLDSHQDRKHSEDLTSEVDNYVDAPATMESETEVDDDGRYRSGVFNVSEHDDPDSDEDDERIEDLPEFSDSQSVGNTPSSEKGRRSVLRWISSFSDSDTSISTDNNTGERVKTAGSLPSTGSYKSKLADSSSEVTPENKDAQGSNSHEKESISGSDVDLQPFCASRGTSSSPRAVSLNAQSHLPIVQSAESSNCGLKKEDTDESITSRVDSPTSGALLDGKDLNSSSSGAALSVSVDEKLADSGNESDLSTVSPTDQQQLPSSAAPGMEVSCVDEESIADDPIAEAETYSNDTLDDALEVVAVTTSVSATHSQTSVAELSTEQSPAFDTIADESVVESHEVTVVDKTLIPTQVVAGKVTSQVSLENNKLMGDDDSSTSSVCGEQLCAVSGESDSSYVGQVRLDNVASDVVPDKELVGSVNGADNYNHAPTKPSPSNDTPSGAGIETLESEPTVSALEVVSEGSHGSPLEDNGNPVTLQASPNQSDTDPATKSHHECLDSSETSLEELIQVNSPTANHAESSSAGECNNSMDVLNMECEFPTFGLIPETASPCLDEMPPLPPLPPMQWFIGKLQDSSVHPSLGEPADNIQPPLPTIPPPMEASLNTQSVDPISIADDESELLLPDIQTNNTLDPSSIMPLPTLPEQGLDEDLGSRESDSMVETEDVNSKAEQISKSRGDAEEYPDTEPLMRKQTGKEEEENEGEGGHCDGEGDTEEASKGGRSVVGDTSAMWPVKAFTVAPTLDSEIPKETVPTVKLPRPRSPLVDAVAAHDRSMMRKVGERVRAPTESKEEYENSLLAQIRNKSFSLKPAGVMMRPNIKAGPKTNLKVAAILEKANTIRQAMAGSDEDNDSDSWSE